MHFYLNIEIRGRIYKLPENTIVIHARALVKSTSIQAITGAGGGWSTTISHVDYMNSKE